MDSLSSLIMFCVVMFAGAFASGYIPLSMSISEARLRLVTIFGAGLLVGTALVVIIPEGVAMHYEAQARHAELHAATAAATKLPPGVVTVPSTAHEPGGSATGALPDAEGAGHAHAHDADITHEHPGHGQIGAALAIGFAFQLVVDRLSGELHGHSHAVTVPSSSPPAVGATSEELNVRANTGGVQDGSAKGKSAIIGMVVHAAIDGVALGAAVREGDSALGWLVFLAIILHKFPSSFGLSSYLLHHGISHDGVRKRLLLFSSAAPIGALLTYTVLSANLFTYQQEMLALCLLFSGGTFLYVATAHVLPEIQAGHAHGAHDEDDDEEDGHSHSHGGHRTPPKMKWAEVGLLVAGVLLPLFAPVHHGH